MRRAIQSLIAAALAVMLGQPAEARVLALSIGIDAYETLTPLDGAVRDARDVSATLRRFGAYPVFTLINEDATRVAVIGAMDQLLSRAAPGDVIVLHFSGHGLQEPALIAGEEEDGLDETFALGGFNYDGAAGQQQRLVDNEIFAWASAAKARGVRVVVVADTCHAGGLQRSVSLKARLAPQATVAMPSPSPAASQPSPQVAALDNLLFFSAALESEKAYEVMIKGEKRGALSYAFARGIEGPADLNRDGVIERIELARYVLANTRQLADSLHTPDAYPRGTPNHPLFGATASATVSNSAPLLRVAPESALAELEGVRTKDGPADLAYDDANDLVNANGEKVAVTPQAPELQSIVDKFRLLAWLRSRAEIAPLRVSLYPDDRVKAVGEMFWAEITAEDRQHPFLVAFNLNNRGGVDYLYPYHAGEPHELAVDAGWTFDVRMTPPLGADHLVAIAANQPLDALIAQIRGGGATSAELLRNLPSHLDGVQAEIAIQAVFTAPN